MDVSEAIFAKLAATSAVTDIVSTFSGAPSIFNGWPAPREALRPYLLIEPLMDVPWDDAIEQGRAATYTISAYADAATGNTLFVLTEAVRAALHKQALAITGARFVLARCTGVVVAPTDDTLSGRELTFRILAMEAE
jgi:hypothetical protein